MKADGADAVPELLEALRDKKQQVHDKAANALVLMTMDGVPDLLEKVRAAERKEQWMAQHHVAAAAANPLANLVKDLADKDTNVRIQATLTLGSIGAQAQAALPALTRLLTDENAQLRFSAAMAIAHVQKNKAEHQLVVQRILREIRNQMEDLRGLTPSRAGVANSVVQGQLRQIVMTYITIKVAARFEYSTAWLDEMISNLTIDAVPALVDGVNYISTFGLGDC